MRPTLVERALQLAQTGRLPTLTAVRNALKAEGFVGAEAYLSGAGIRRQIRDLIRAARAASDAASSAGTPTAPAS